MIDVSNVKKSFRSGETWVEALRGVTCRIPKGRCAFIVGPSGSGKSTLLYLMGALDRPGAGTIRVEGLVKTPGSHDIDSFIKPYALEERIYRMRCVEAWSIIVPWVGVPLADVHGVLAKAYEGERFVSVASLAESASVKTLAPEALNDTNEMKLYVFGHDEEARLVALLDNLGKGASGAAVQNLNLVLGLEESAGLG